MNLCIGGFKCVIDLHQKVNCEARPSFISYPYGSHTQNNSNNIAVYIFVAFCAPLFTHLEEIVEGPRDLLPNLNLW